MSHVRDLALLEKWTEATSGIHTISPTSPKATSFCCCPQRRRYNLKHPKKQQQQQLLQQQQQQRQKFFDEHDFRLIEDATQEAPLQQHHHDSSSSSSSHNSSNNKSINCYTSGDIVDSAATFQLKKKESEKSPKDQRSPAPTNEAIALNTKNKIACEKSEQHLIAAVGVSGSSSSSSSGGKGGAGAEAVAFAEDNTIFAVEEQWRHDKGSCCNSNFSYSNIDNSCSCEQQQATTTTWTTTQQLQDLDSSTATTQQIIKNNKSAIIADDQSGVDIVDFSGRQDKELEQQQQQQQQQHQHKPTKSSDYDDCVEQEEENKQIQRLSNNTNNHNNNKDKEKKTSNKQDSGSSATINSNSNDISNCSHHPNSCCSNCQLDQQQALVISNDSNIDDDFNDKSKTLKSPQQQQQQNKMTITATTVADRKRSECGLTALSSDLTAKTTMPTTPTSTSPTPHMTTVIKTTMVKRSPNEPATTTPTATTTTPTAPSTSTAAVTKPTATTTTNPPATTAKTVVVTATNPAVFEQQHQQQINNKNLSSNSSNNYNKNNIFINNKCDESNAFRQMLAQQQQQPQQQQSQHQPAKSVKERIAAYAAGNDQTKNHDNGLRKSQCISNKTNMTTTIPLTTGIENISTTTTTTTPPTITTTKTSAINIHNDIDKNYSNGNCNQLRATSPASNSSQSSLNSAVSLSSGTSSVAATGSGSTSPTPSKNSINSTSQKVDMFANVATAAVSQSTPKAQASASSSFDTAGVTRLRQAVRLNSVGNSGAATMPRLRSPQVSVAGNERSIKYGSNSAALTADKKFLGYAHKPQNGDSSGSEMMVAPNLAALDNLDLALSLKLNDELNDDDGEDPYFVLQEYLERVKLEINEVFELHKSRQRMQQAQQVHRQLEQTFDDLARSTESDSGFDSASGQSQTKLTRRATPIAATATATVDRVTKNEKVIEKYAIDDQSDINEHRPAATATTPTVPVNKSLQLDITTASSAAPLTANDDEQTTPTTTNLHALPPPPLSPQSAILTANSNKNNNNNNNNNNKNNINNNNVSSSATFLRLRQQLLAKADAAAATTPSSTAAADEVNIWANKFLHDLANLMATDKSTVANGSSSLHLPALEQREQSTTNGLVLKPEKHATIPLQSFNLDCSGFVDSSGQSGSSSNSNPNNKNKNNSNGYNGRTNAVYLRTLSEPTPYQYQKHQQQQQQHNDNRASMANGGGIACNRRNFETFNGEQNCNSNNINNNNSSSSNRMQQHQTLINSKRALTPDRKTPRIIKSTILQIEESAPDEYTEYFLDKLQEQSNNSSPASLLHKIELQRQRRQRQLEDDMETIRNALLSRSQHVAAMEANNHGSNSNCNAITTTTTTTTSAAFMPKQQCINQTRTAAASPTSALSKSLTSTTAMTPSKITATTEAKTSNATTTSTPTTSYLLNGNGDATKKGSTSTIWTSEESILRSVGAVDEDNNSTSSSACEEASCVLSSGKSGISLDSSGLDNDNNESGIGTATPPKELAYWKNAHNHHHHPHHHHHHHHHHHRQQNDNESVSSLDALRKMTFQKSNSVASSDEPDRLEVLSLCDEPQGDDDICTELNESLDGVDDRAEQHQQEQQQKQKQDQRSSSALQVIDADDADDDDAAHIDDDEIDEGHDEFETITYCDCGEFTDGDANSNSICNRSANSNKTSLKLPSSSKISNDGQAVVLRRKYNAAPPIMVPYGRAQKCRSHSLDTSSLPSSYQQYQLQQQAHTHHHNSHHHHNNHYHHPHHHYTSQLTRKLHQHLHPARTKERVQLTLALRQEPFQSLLSPTHFQELPSPSSASLHSGHESLGIQELTTKSNSAPLLLKQEKKRDDFAAQNLTLRYSRSQSDRYLAEIEAVEACKWLRAAGFPQYAQMYEDHQFPIDLTNVAKDHTNLENDQLQSLYRRLCVLNRCANMRLDQSHKAQTPQKEDSDDENFALSENWTFQPHIRRWSRIGEMGLELPAAGKLNVEKTESSSKESSPDRFEDDTYDVSGAGLSLTLPTVGITAADSADNSMHEGTDGNAVRLRRSGSERFKDGAKALLRRVESIKSRRRKRQNREGIVISGPQALDLSQLGQRSSMRKPDAVYSTPPSPSAVSPMHAFPKSPFFGNELKVPSHSENFLSPNRASPKRTPTTPRSMRTSPLHFFCSSAGPMPHLREGRSDDSSSYFSDSQESSAGGILTVPSRKAPSKTRRFLQRTGKVDDIATHSDSECHQGRKLLIKDANTNSSEAKVKKLTRGGSLNLGKDPKKREGLRSSSFRSRSTTRKDMKTTDDGEHVKRTPVVRWHSFQMEERPHMIFRKCFSQKIDPSTTDMGVPFAAMSAGQLQIIRKLALVILTGYMERHCPTHRSGWNWELPKFIKKIKMPDYKDKKVFGVPLLLILQRTGQTLPLAVRSAFRWLQLNALDQIGLFRKSGVKSRIIRLKELIEYSENQTQCMAVFDSQQAYDVADMLKQYFRDLPESLLTNKMSETFATIFQHLPPEIRLDAVQCAVLLLPDENREILYALLEFLTLVADNSQQNQMTANNLAVCLAPSLFHNSISTGAGSVAASPRRRGKGAGVPDVKELTEAKASHECLAFMIDNYRKIYTATKEKINKCNFGYLEESKPVALETLGEGVQWHNWRGYLYECTSATIKEGREKTRGWFTVTAISDPAVEIAYKKVGDGIPLRLWRCITEVEGPPKDVLDYIIRQRASWDINLLQSQTVKKLDEHTEIFQYAVDGQVTTDFCVLRSWQTDLPRGACVIVETSIDHAKAKPLHGSVRGVVLASRYLIEPCGSGRSRLLHLARVDIKGKTPEWYNKSYGHICSHYLSRIRQAFKNIAEGPESKV